MFTASATATSASRSASGVAARAFGASETNTFAGAGWNHNIHNIHNIWTFGTLRTGACV